MASDGRRGNAKSGRELWPCEKNVPVDASAAVYRG